MKKLVKYCVFSGIFLAVISGLWYWIDSDGLKKTLFTKSYYAEKVDSKVDYYTSEIKSFNKQNRILHIAMKYEDSIQQIDSLLAYYGYISSNLKEKRDSEIEIYLGIDIIDLTIFGADAEMFKSIMYNMPSEEELKYATLKVRNNLKSIKICTEKLRLEKEKQYNYPSLTRKQVKKKYSSKTNR